MTLLSSLRILQDEVGEDMADFTGDALAAGARMLEVLDKRVEAADRLLERGILGYSGNLN